MENVLQSCYLSVLEVKNRDELQSELVRFAQHLGFETIAATTVIDHFLGEPEFITVSNAPAVYRDISLDRSRGKRDPVSQHCRIRSVPIVWNQSTYVNAGSGELWEQQAPFGYHCGISLAFHMPKGRHFWLGVNRDQALPSDPAELTRTVAEVQLFAAHAQEGAARIVVPDTESGALALTARELETLRWTMEGKTAWEVGRVLGISEQTAARHLHHATRKLDCVNKHQAVLRALRLGLIA
jgi:DNA-binding CsgD family transcriptional regulator